MAVQRLSSKSIKSFSGLKNLDDVTAQLDSLIAKLFDIQDAKSATVSLLSANDPVPSTNAGDLVLDYRDGDVTPGISDGKKINPFNVGKLSGTITNAQHGVQGSQVLDAKGNVVGTMHSIATTTIAGFLSATDKVKIDGISGSVVASTSVPPAVDATTGAVGTATTYARGDHTHQASVAAPVAIGAANAAGSSINLSRADHVHSHGNLGGGALHDDAVSGGASGFMTGTQVANLATLVALQLSVVNISGQDYLQANVGGTLKHLNANFV